jgi:sulfite reductase (NADPH) hemoprotein beta-component
MTTERHFATEKDLDEFVDALGKFERGEWSPEAWKAFRLTRGVYGQRQPNTQMIRIKIPQGVLSARQLARIGDVAGEFSRGIGHVTTRQNIQLHFVDLAAVPTVMERIQEVGLTTREACGNTVRNVVACPFAGVCADAPFDVSPYAEAVTRHFLRNEICQVLPRKFKITVSGCAWEWRFWWRSVSVWGYRSECRSGWGHPRR